MIKYFANIIAFFLMSFILHTSNSPFFPLHIEIFGNGKTVLVIHGGPGMDSTYFKPYLLPAKSFCRIVLYDQRGCGKSIQNNAYRAAISDSVQDIENLRKFYGEKKIILLAHSFGSVLALKYAVQYPQRVRALIIVSGYARKHPEQYKYFHISSELRKKIEAVEKSHLNKEEKRMKIGALRFSLYFYQNKFRNITFLENFYQSISFNKKVFQDIVSSSDYENFDERKRLKALHNPFLVICGKHDTVTPVFLSEELTNTIRTGELRVFNFSGHFPFIEEQEKFIKTLRDFIHRL